MELTGGELAFARMTVATFMMKTWLADRDPRYRVSSPSAQVVRVTDGDVMHQLDITLDETSLLPVKVRSDSLSDLTHPVPREELTTEWQTVQSIRFPRRWTIFHSGIRLAEVQDARTVVNTGLDLKDLTAQPPDGKPVLSSR